MISSGSAQLTIVGRQRIANFSKIFLQAFRPTKLLAENAQRNAAVLLLVGGLQG